MQIEIRWESTGVQCKGRQEESDPSTTILADPSTARHLLVRALHPRLTLILVHPVITVMRFPLAGVHLIHINFVNGDALAELLDRLACGQYLLEQWNLVRIDRLGERDVKLDEHVARVVMSLCGHALAANDLQLA
jgi:hypothetical protein